MIHGRYKVVSAFFVPNSLPKEELPPPDEKKENKSKEKRIVRNFTPSVKLTRE